VVALLASRPPWRAAVSLFTFLPNIYRSAATVIVEIASSFPSPSCDRTVTSAVETRLRRSAEVLEPFETGSPDPAFGLYGRPPDESPLEDVINACAGHQAGTQERRRSGACATATVALHDQLQGSDRHVSLSRTPLLPFTSRRT